MSTSSATSSAARRLAAPRPDDLTVFKSLGIALEDVAFGELIYRRAVAAGAGRPL
jgi:ornithine cyclodeaminase/alanine dehydrogenase-like protein (mu-crystallin family)